MLRQSLRCLSGHGDLFPTTKAAAHLTPKWVMSREVPHAPGRGKCFVSITEPRKYNKFQLNVPECHHTAVVSVDAETLPHHCQTVRPSKAAIAAVSAGVKNALDHHHHKTNENEMARATIAAKVASERFAKERTFVSTYPHSDKPGYEKIYDFWPVHDYMADRTNDCRKIGNNNPMGWTHEHFPWQPALPPPPPPAAKK